MAFWEAKFIANVARDERVTSELKAIGWQTMVIWECEAADQEVLTERLATFLKAPTPSAHS
jgi:DNA mismatch endonuclease (patch repair protein)